MEGILKITKYETLRYRFRVCLPYNKLFWPDLKDDIAKAIIGEITTIEEREVESVIIIILIIIIRVIRVIMVIIVLT